MCVSAPGSVLLVGAQSSAWVIKFKAYTYVRSLFLFSWSRRWLPLAPYIVMVIFCLQVLVHTASGLS